MNNLNQKEQLAKRYLDAEVRFLKGDKMNKDVESIPRELWEYRNLIEFMKSNPGMYSLDNRREKLHLLLCEIYGLTHQETKEVTDNLNKFEDNPWLIHQALCDLVDKKSNVYI